MEETKEGGKEPDSAWNSRVVGMGGEQLSESLLAHGEERPCTKGNLNGKARTAFPGCIGKNLRETGQILLIRQDGLNL